jgi:hypothetical protein
MKTKKEKEAWKSLFKGLSLEEVVEKLNTFISKKHLLVLIKKDLVDEIAKFDPPIGGQTFLPYVSAGELSKETEYKLKIIKNGKESNGQKTTEKKANKIGFNQ